MVLVISSILCMQQIIMYIHAITFILSNAIGRVSSSFELTYLAYALKYNVVAIFEIIISHDCIKERQFVIF